jgi:P27 family predicted phage terminase small subunit
MLMPTLFDSDGVSDMVKFANMRDKAFKQVMKCASELGLTITSRCKLVVPKQEEKPANKFARFGAG